MPEKEKDFKAGNKYNWRVTARLPGDKEEIVVKSSFQVATTKEAQELAKLAPFTEPRAPAAGLLLAAVAFESRGVYDEALKLYRRLADASPDEGEFQEALAYYYQRAGRPDEAKIARDKAVMSGVAVPQK